MIFQTSDVSISNSNIKDPIGTSIFYSKFDVQNILYVTVGVDNIIKSKIIKYHL